MNADIFWLAIGRPLRGCVPSGRIKSGFIPETAMLTIIVRFIDSANSLLFHPNPRLPKAASREGLTRLSQTGHNVAYLH
jgi:hypothetical protein